MSKRLRPLLLPTLSGILYFLSWIGFGIWPLAFVCFVPLLVGLEETTPRQAFGRGAWMGFVTHLGGYTWIIHLLQVFAFAPFPVAFAGYLLLCVAQGLLFGAMAFAYRWAALRSGWRAAALLPIALAAAEFVFPLLFQSYTGVALMPVAPLAQVAELGGPILMGTVQAVVNGALYDSVAAFRANRRSPIGSLIASLGVLAAAGGFGALRISQIERRQKAAPTLDVGLARPDVGEIALHANPYASVRTLWDQTAELHVRGADLVVWPEGGYNFALPADALEAKKLLGGVPVDLIAGATRSDGERYWNSALAVDRQGHVTGHYDKIALLAFGEYIPGGEWFPVVYKWSPLASHLSRGTTTAPLRLGPWRFATFICYEDILPAMVRATMRDLGEGRANALVNLTNDSWYGAGHEQEQHLMLAAVRTIEHRRWLLRATSTGISAFVDATGKVVQRIDRDVRGVAVRSVPMISGTTVYEVVGDWPGWAALALLAFLAIRKRGVSRPSRGAPSS